MNPETDVAYPHQVSTLDRYRVYDKETCGYAPELIGSIWLSLIED
ncbi:hypothetical protein QGP82_20560 [Leptothoe sp. LEGE 181152]|nr:hypothetical protein [Adonisia turfae]MDV3351110.1 hypothetical protein [Leptothoe sp. LEGE 181152]